MISGCKITQLKLNLHPINRSFFHDGAKRAKIGYTHALTHEAQTLTRDVVTAPFRLRTYRLIRKILIGFILVSIANVLFSYFFYTPKMYRIIRENRDLVIKYRILQDRIRSSAAPRGRNTPPRQLRLPFALLDRHAVDRRRLAALPRHANTPRMARRRLRPADGRHVAAARRAGPHALPRVGVVRRTAEPVSQDKEKTVGGGSGHLAHRPHRRCTTTTSAHFRHAPLPPRTPAACSAHTGDRPRLRPGHAGLRHGRRRGRERRP